MSRLRHSAEEKYKLEEAACRYFLHAYNRRHETHFQIKRHRERPDFITFDPQSGEMLGIEVTHLFYDKEEAKLFLGRQKQNIRTLMTRATAVGVLNALLVRKSISAESYDFKGRVFLIIRVASPIFTKSSLARSSVPVVIPESRFDQIWMVFYDIQRGTWRRLMRLK